MQELFYSWLVKAKPYAIGFAVGLIIGAIIL